MKVFDRSKDFGHCQNNVWVRNRCLLLKAVDQPNAGIFLTPPSSILKQTSDYGTVNGEVTGQSTAAANRGSVTVYKIAGLPDSVEKSAGYTDNSVISPSGHFMLKLPSGVYRITVVYHDGKDQIIENYAVWPGSHTLLNLIHWQWIFSFMICITIY